MAEAAPVVKSPPAKPAARAKRASTPLRLKIPPILLEGDAPSPMAASGPGERYALGPEPVVAPAPFVGGELPDSYGSQQLSLAARDPHWLYAHWDFSRDQLRKYNALSTDGHLWLRIYAGTAEGEPISQIHLHADSRTWFAPVPKGGATYVAELGYYEAGRKWVSLARSGPAFSPPDNLSEDTSIRFATIPAAVPFRELVELVKESVREHAPLVEAMQQMRALGRRDLPAPELVHERWTPAQEKALAEVISIDSVRRMRLGGLEITELIRRQIAHHASSIEAARFSQPAPGVNGHAAPGISSGGLPVSGGVSSAPGISSPAGAAGAAEGKRGFWFKVNAELVIYGATEPDAKVTLGGRPIKLRPDGSFSFRFSLPDGEYALEAAARAADGLETRRVELRFRRQTACRGHVGAHPQDENLKPPSASAAD
ncbi:MAG TPA: DUF4912 domain-containing protein [Verrucomicrobiae bacterium]|jgi:hypothetical protein